MINGHEISDLRIIRNSVSFNVGEDILHLERSFDTGLVAVFTDRAALDFYNDHPEHKKVAALTGLLLMILVADVVMNVSFSDQPTKAGLLICGKSAALDRFVDGVHRAAMYALGIPPIGAVRLSVNIRRDR
jgi:hypothetical protein